jgi:hypothetical protein
MKELLLRCLPIQISQHLLDFCVTIETVVVINCIF